MDVRAVPANVDGLVLIALDDEYILRVNKQFKAGEEPAPVTLRFQHFPLTLLLGGDEPLNFFPVGYALF